jgi:hypothetical protein
MDEYIKRLKEKKYGGSFERTSEWLAESQNKLKNKQNLRRTFKMKQYFLRHKLQFAIIIFFAFLVAACNYPVSQNDTVGYVLSWTAPTSNTSVAESLNKLEWYKNSNITSSVKKINGTEITEYKLLVQSFDDKLVMNYKNDLEKINQLTSLKIIPINESVKRPVYSAALHSFFKIDINSTKMSDEQVQSEIKRQLNEAGYSGIDVSYKYENGRKKLELKLSENSNATDNKTLEVNVDNNNGNQVVKLKTMKSDVNLSKMTDDEIRTHIKAENKDDNLTDKEIIIKRDGDNVQVNVNKEEKK